MSWVRYPRGEDWAWWEWDPEPPKVQAFWIKPYQYPRWRWLPHREPGFPTWFAPLWIPLLPAVVLMASAWLPRHRQRGVCRGCGYDLCGNTTGICPECGAAAARVP